MQAHRSRPGVLRGRSADFEWVMDKNLFPSALEFVVNVLSSRQRAGLLSHAPAEALYGLAQEPRTAVAKVGSVVRQNARVSEPTPARAEGVRRDFPEAVAVEPESVSNSKGLQRKAVALMQTSLQSVGGEETLAQRLELLRAEALVCTRCPELAAARAQVVFGQGRVGAELMLIGEAPGMEEDQEGRPFAGESGELLEKMLKAMGLSMGEVYATNVLKCHPFMVGEPGAVRPPQAEELEKCMPYLAAQIALLKPKVIVAMGAGAMHAMFGGRTPMGSLRSHWHEIQGIPVMPTFHPRYLLRNDDVRERRKVWEDLMQVMERLGIEVTARHRAFFLKSA